MNGGLLNGPSDPGTYKGKIWSFSTEPEGVWIVSEKPFIEEAVTLVIVMLFEPESLLLENNT